VVADWWSNGAEAIDRLGTSGYASTPIRATDPDDHLDALTVGLR
jgi:hypothetical protein